MTAGAASTGKVWRLADNAGGQATGFTAITADASFNFGPFADAARLDIIAESGILTYDYTSATPVSSDVVAGAPAALDTLNELAAALGDDADFAGTVTTALAAKAPLASPALTGNPTAPTQTAANNSTRLATTAYVDTGLALKADLASPTLTGNPTAPTQTAADNSTRLATTAYADTGLALKANLASPTFTGTPAAPTAAPGTNTTQVASTEFVTAAVAASGGDGLTAPPSSGWTWRGQSTASINSSGGIEYLSEGTGQTTNVGVRLRTRAMPVGDFTLEFSFKKDTTPHNFTVIGAALYASGSAASGLSWQGTNAPQVMAHYFTNATTYGSTVFTARDAPNLEGRVYFRIVVVSGVSRTLFFSTDKVNWREMATMSDTATLTPDEIGFGGTFAVVGGISLDHWLVT